ncbi:hypothetical protein ACG3SL_14460 [Sphingomonas sp. CJ20]
MLLAAAIVLGIGALTAQHPHANIEILTHQPDDVAPRQVRAAVDLGLVAVSVLVTWSRRLAY